MNTENTCKNCGHEIAENFCPNCGQKKYKRINSQYIKDEIQYSILHTNKGFFYTIKNLVKNPGKTAREYLDGNRVNHYKPILLAFVMGGISTFITFKLLNYNRVLDEIPTEFYNQNSSVVMSEYSAFMQNYSTFIFLLSIPIFALASFIAYKGMKENYFEHIIINSYLYSLFVIFCCVIMYPIMYFTKDPSLVVTISFINTLIFIFIFPWFFKNLYPKLSKKQNRINVLLYIILSGLGYLLFIFFMGIIYIAYFFTTHDISALKPQ